MLDSLAPARRRFVLLVAGLVVIAVILVVALAVVRRSPTVRPVAQDALGPVLLVPGYGGSTSALEVLAGRLRDAGRDATVVALAGDGTGDLNGQARVLGTAVRAALRRTGASSVDLVGYSAGGIVVRLWIRDDGGGPLTRRVVTLGTPHHGTDTAALAADLSGGACPEACRQLATDSDLIRTLDAGDETPPGPRWVSIWTTDDQTVVPPSSASLSGALDLTVQSVCPGKVVSHGDLPRDPTVDAMVLAELGRTLPATPPTGVCTVSR